MARPSKHENQYPVRGRLAEEFWALLKKKSFAQITVSELVKAVDCNRATFYYHFDSIENMAWQLMMESLPVELPQIAAAYFRGEIEAVEVTPETLGLIEPLSILVGSNGAPHFAALIEDALKGMWIKIFNLDAIKEDKEVIYILEFMAGGVVSMISRYGSPLDLAALSQCMSLMNNLFAKSALSFITMKGISNSNQG